MIRTVLEDEIVGCATHVDNLLTNYNLKHYPVQFNIYRADYENLKGAKEVSGLYQTTCDQGFSAVLDCMDAIQTVLICTGMRDQVIVSINVGL